MMDPERFAIGFRDLCHAFGRKLDADRCTMYHKALARRMTEVEWRAVVDRIITEAEAFPFPNKCLAVHYQLRRDNRPPALEPEEDGESPRTFCAKCGARLGEHGNIVKHLNRGQRVKGEQDELYERSTLLAGQEWSAPYPGRSMLRHKAACPRYAKQREEMAYYGIKWADEHAEELEAMRTDHQPAWQDR